MFNCSPQGITLGRSRDSRNQGSVWTVNSVLNTMPPNRKIISPEIHERVTENYVGSTTMHITVMQEETATKLDEHLIPIAVDSQLLQK